MTGNNESVIKECVTCGEELKGRADKKFCDHYCRNNYNNKLSAQRNNTVRNINNALSKNRRILEQLFEKNELNNFPIKVTREKLLQMGFQFKYHTHYDMVDNLSCMYCYEYGYGAIQNSLYLIKKNTNKNEHTN